MDTGKSLGQDEILLDQEVESGMLCKLLIVNEGRTWDILEENASIYRQVLVQPGSIHANSQCLATMLTLSYKLTILSENNVPV